MRKSTQEIVRIGQNALRELELSVTTQAGRVRIDRVRHAMLVLDEERAEIGSVRAETRVDLAQAARAVEAAAVQLKWAQTQLEAKGAKP